MPNDKKAYAQREKAYMQGKLFPLATNITLLS